MQVTDTSDFKGFDPARTDVPRTPARTSTGQAPDTDPDKTYTFAALSQELEVDESTIRRRWWMDKIAPAYRHCPKPLRVVVRTTKSGSEVYEFTSFALEAFRAFQLANNKGQGDKHLAEIAARYPAPAPETQVIEPEVEPMESDGKLTIPSGRGMAIAPNQNTLSLRRQNIEADMDSLLEGIADSASLRTSRRRSLQELADIDAQEDALIYLAQRKRRFNQIVRALDQADIDNLGKLDDSEDGQF